MSTGYECVFFNTGNKWYYLLQDWNCPVGAWDWREYATCYGSFVNEALAQMHLSLHHCNPGGWSTTKDVDLSEDPVLKKCVLNCRK